MELSPYGLGWGGDIKVINKETDQVVIHAKKKNSRVR